MHLEDLLDSELALPSIPRAIALVLSELDSEDPDLRAINQHISTDIGLTTRLLSMVNSAAFQLSHSIGTVTEALALLGLDQVRSLATAAAMAGVFKTVPGLELQRFWRYSLDVAKLTRKLARYVKVNPSLAYTTGLIHASGELVMHLGMPDQMRYLNERSDLLGLDRAAAERHLLGYSYAEVGAGFAERWHFPQLMMDAIEHQCAPFDNEPYEALAGVLHLTSWRARAQEAGIRDNKLIDSFPSAVAEMLNFDIHEVLQNDPIDWTTNQESVSMM